MQLQYSDSFSKRHFRLMTRHATSNVKVVKLTLGGCIPFLVWIRYQSSKTADMDDTWASLADARMRKLLLLRVIVDLHVWDACL